MPPLPKARPGIETASGCERVDPEWSALVALGAHSELNPDIEPGPKLDITITR